MANKTATTSQMKRLEVPYFEGINTSVAHNISKKQEFDFITNARSSIIGNIEKRRGYTRLGNDIGSTYNAGIFHFEGSDVSNHFYRISKIGTSTNIYRLGMNDKWSSLSGKGTNLSDNMTCLCSAENCLFIVNGVDKNRYISQDGVTVYDSDDDNGHFSGCPVSNKIAYYKDCLYAADYTVGSTRYRNSILKSSNPLGLISLVDGDQAIGVNRVKVTDTKYIRATDTLDIYRGAVKITTLYVNAKGEDYIDVTTTDAALLSADEIWVANTWSDTRSFRWPDNPTSGINAKQYDTFKLTGGSNDRIRMITPIGNVLMIANSNNVGVWDNYKWDSYKTENMDIGIGCVSDQGFVKALGTLWFIHYTGIYSTTGGYPKLMSAKVDTFIQGATRAGLENCSAGRKGMSVFFAIGDCTMYRPDGSVDRVVKDVVIEYNMRQDNWFVHSNISAAFFMTYSSSQNFDLLEFCGTEGEVFELFSGTSDDGKEIPLELTTSPFTLSTTFETIVYPKDIIIELERGSGVKCFVSLDGGPFYEIKGEASKGLTVLKVTPQKESDQYARCRNITLSIREFSKSLCKLSRIAINFTDTLEFEVNRPQYGE